MEFGKTNIEQLNEVNFILPPEPLQNFKILDGIPNSTPYVYVGCPRWGTKEWLGNFYPEHIKEKDFLTYYSKLFNCIELNTTYYRIPSQAQVQHWRSMVSHNFKFCPKFPQFITHIAKLQYCDEEVAEFIRSLSFFEENLGPVFLMPHPQMGPAQLSVIKRFIERLPAELNVFLELRHPGWFAGGLNKPLYDFLADYNIGLVITDAAGRRDCVHMHLSKREAFIRFVGNDLHTTDYTRIQDWTKRIRLWLQEGLESVYFFMHQHKEINAPLLNKYLIEQLNFLPNVHLNYPQIIRPQATLFD